MMNSGYWALEYLKQPSALIHLILKVLQHNTNEDYYIPGSENEPNLCSLCMKTLIFTVRNFANEPFWYDQMTELPKTLLNPTLEILEDFFT